MNGKDRHDLGTIIQLLSQQDRSRQALEQRLVDKLNGFKEGNEKGHEKLQNSLDTVEKNLFHPQKGVWHAVTRNTSFRRALTKALWILLPIGLTGGGTLIYGALSGKLARWIVSYLSLIS